MHWPLNVLEPPVQIFHQTGVSRRAEGGNLLVPPCRHTNVCGSKGDLKVPVGESEDRVVCTWNSCRLVSSVLEDRSFAKLSPDALKAGDSVNL